VASEARHAATVHAEVNYVRNPPLAGDAVLEFVTEAEERSTMQVLPGRTVPIIDTRGIGTDLDREGFVLVHHVSAITDFDRIQGDPIVDQQYIDETTELLAALVGASRVFMLGGGKKRYGESATEKLAPLSNAKPARYAHADNTDTSAVGLVEMVAQFVDDLDLAGYSRWALYNIWRAVTPPPQDFPLAVCDARTVAPGDEITVAAVTEEHGFDIRHDTTGYLYNPAHEWHYYRDMTRDEVLVFKAHDTDAHRAGRVPHTAFTDPSCPRGVATRASVEMRGLALFD
jgi:hypothetical protein